MMVAVALVVTLGVLGPNIANAGPGQELNDARALVRHGKHKEAIPKLNYLLYPRARLAARTDLIEAHVLLGVAYFESGDLVSAEPEFEKALFLDTTLALDALLFSKRAIEFFDKKKRSMADEARKSAVRRRLAKENAYWRKLALTGFTEEKNSRFVSFLPFGVGQFQNDHTRKGSLFLVSQVVFGGGSMGIWLWQVLKYGFNGSVPIDEASTVRRLQQVQIVSGAAALVLMVWGIVDAQRYFQRSKLTRGVDIDRLKQLLNQKNSDDDDDASGDDAGASKKPKPTSFKLLPTALPSIHQGGGGVVLSWEF